MAKLGKGMLFSVEQAFVGREEIRAPLKTPAWEASVWHVGWWNLITSVRLIQVGNNRNDYSRYFLGVCVLLIEVSA